MSLHTIVTSSDFVQCNGAKLYRELLETNTLMHTKIKSSDLYRKKSFSILRAVLRYNV